MHYQILAVNNDFVERKDSRFFQASTLRNIVDCLKQQKIFIKIKEWSQYVNSIAKSLVDILNDKYQNKNGGNNKLYYTAAYYAEHLLLTFVEDNPTR